MDSLLEEKKRPDSCVWSFSHPLIPLSIEKVLLLWSKS